MVNFVYYDIIINKFTVKKINLNTNFYSLLFFNTIVQNLYTKVI